MAKSNAERQAAFTAAKAEKGQKPRRVWLSDEELKATKKKTGEQQTAEALRAAVLGYPLPRTPSHLPDGGEMERLLVEWERRLAEVWDKSKNKDWGKIPRFQNVRRLVDQIREIMPG